MHLREITTSKHRHPWNRKHRGLLPWYLQCHEWRVSGVIIPYVNLCIHSVYQKTNVKHPEESVSVAWRREWTGRATVCHSSVWRATSWTEPVRSRAGMESGTKTSRHATVGLKQGLWYHEKGITLCFIRN